MKKYIIILFAGLLALSCDKFLEEELLSGENSSTIVSTEDNMEYLITACYAPLRIWYGTENGWDLTEAGTDLYTRGLDNRSAGFCTYTDFVGEEQDRMSAVWYEFYKALNTVNLGIANIDALEYQNPDVKLARKGELYFLRAHYLWLITEVWGNSHFMTEPVESPVYEAYHTDISTFYQQIFSDLDSALALSPESTTEYGRVIKPVAIAFLARTHLMWASYNKYGLTIMGRNFVTANSALANEHYALALDYVNQLIDNYSYSLQPWDILWSLGSIKNDEVIWSVNYSDNPQYTTGNFSNPWDEDGEPYNTEYIIQREGGNMGHLMWEIRYENIGRGMVRDIQNGRGYQRWMPTKYFIDLFDQNADVRFNGSFKNTWYCNDATTIPKWKPKMIVDGTTVNVPMALWTKNMFGVGDTAIYFSKDSVPASQKAKFAATDQFYFHPQKGYLIIDINDMYLPDGTPNDAKINRQYYFPITKKYTDTTRLTIPQQYSRRDFFVLRMGEMYLIAAEAALESGDAAAAYGYLLELANNRSVVADGAALLSAYGVSGASDLTLGFILDERARELATENLRFFDLKRTGTLLNRVQSNNTDAAPAIKDYHLLRFIPQEQLDAVRNTDEFTQNPGY